MTKDDIIHMAREAGCLEPGSGGDPNGLWEPSGAENVTELMFCFAELLEAKIRADEREACAALCSEVAAGRDAEDIEEAILARGKK
ncbi:MAG: hypothetical protein ACK5X3_19945 [Pseudomonadota bacterium]